MRGRNGDKFNFFLKTTGRVKGVQYLFAGDPFRGSTPLVANTCPRNRGVLPMNVKKGGKTMKATVARTLISFSILMMALPSGAAQFTTKEEVVDYLVAHSPYRGTWWFSGPRGARNGAISVAFTKDGGWIQITGSISGNNDGDVKDLAITIKDDKVTVSFKNSTTGALYVLELKEKGPLVGTASGAYGASDIDLSPSK